MFAWIGTALISLLAMGVGWWLWVRWQGAHEAARLAAAICEGDATEVWTLLREGADLNRVPEWFGEPVVIVAVKAIDEGCPPRQILKILRLLLAHGAGVDERGTGWKTALMYAAEGGHREICDLLLLEGADPDARDAFGRMAAWRRQP